MARVFSGSQPSGELHIGNYLGAVQNWVKLQHQHDCLFSVVDLHAITQAYDPASLSQRTLDMAVGLYAAGLDPERAIVFVQSHVPEHTALNWLLNTVTPLGEPARQTELTDKPAATDPARVTRKDPGNPDICNIFTIHQGFSPPATQQLVAHNCRTAGWGCLDCKRVLADHMIATLTPIRERAQALQAEPRKVSERLRAGATRARALARGAGTILHARGAVVGLTSAATIWVVAAIGVALGAAFYWEAAGTTLLVLLVLQGLGRVELVVERQSTQSSLSVHARPDPTVLEDLETVVRRTGLTIERQASRRENVDLVIEFSLRGPKRLHDQVMIALLHHPSVRTVSTSE